MALRTPEKALLGPFRTPYSGPLRAPSVARTLFGQFLRDCLINQDGPQFGLPRGGKKV